MKFKLYFVCILSCFALLFTSCNEATPEQIEETELAIKKEKLLEEMHEEEVKELVNALSEKAKDNSFYYFVNHLYKFVGYSYHFLVIIEKNRRILFEFPVKQLHLLIKMLELKHLFSTFTDALRPVLNI